MVELGLETAADPARVRRFIRDLPEMLKSGELNPESPAEVRRIQHESELSLALTEVARAIACLRRASSKEIFRQRAWSRELNVTTETIVRGARIEASKTLWHIALHAIATMTEFEREVVTIEGVRDAANVDPNELRRRLESMKTPGKVVGLRIPVHSTTVSKHKGRELASVTLKACEAIGSADPSILSAATLMLHYATSQIGVTTQAVELARKAFSSGGAFLGYCLNAAGAVLIQRRFCATTTAVLDSAITHHRSSPTPILNAMVYSIRCETLRRYDALIDELERHHSSNVDTLDVSRRYVLSHSDSWRTLARTDPKRVDAMFQLLGGRQ
jgi:hypothetical protein